MRSKMRVFLAVTAASLLVVAAGCGGNDTSESTGEVEVFSWWTGGGESKGLEKMIADFEKKNSDLKFKNAAVAGGSGTNAKAILESRLQAQKPPDSFQGHAGAELQDYIKAGNLEPLDDFYDEHKLRAVFPEQLVDQITFEDSVYSVPVNVHRSNMLWYSPKVLAEAGIKEPATDMDGFIAQLKTVKEKTKKIPLSLGAQWTADHLLESVLLADLGTDGYNGLWEKGADWSSPEVTTALDHFAQIMEFANQEAASTDWQVAAKNVVDGKAAFNVMGDWAEGYYRELGKKAGTDYNWAPTPGTDGVYMWLSDSFTLPKNAPNPDGAKKWLEEAASKSGQDLFNPAKGSIPARKDADPKLYPGYLGAALKDWKSDELAGSFWHGVVANNKWHTDIDSAVGLFIQHKDVAKLQAQLDQAAAASGQIS